jgi:hypothetical protein
MNKYMAIGAFALLVIFLAILFLSVPEPDLIVVCLLTIAMCGYDFVKSVRSNEQH